MFLSTARLRKFRTVPSVDPVDPRCQSKSLTHQQASRKDLYPDCHCRYGTEPHLKCSTTSLTPAVGGHFSS